MALVARCQDCNRHLEAKFGLSSLVEAQERKGLVRKEKPLSRYRSEDYEELPKKRGYIRVLNLRGSSFENPLVECELVVNKFSKEHAVEQPYEALSWCWGTAKPTAYVNIRKKGKVYAKYVPPELLAALKALRYPKEDRYLWIDAICINQDNPQEKNHQVEMMSEIYGRANRVCIWLGEGDKSSQVALKFIRKEVLQLQNFDELCDSEKASEKWSALLDLMQRPWFSRRWVVQEIALARNAMVYCGHDKISWKKFAVAVELFVEVETATHRLSEVMKKDPKFYHVPGWFEYVSALGASLLVEATGKLFRDYKPNGPLDPKMEDEDESDAETDSEPDSSPASEIDSDSEPEPDADILASNDVLDNRGHPLLSLEYLVSSLSIFEVTMPHDAVYALLAIAKDTIPSAGEQKASMDYAQDAFEEFTQSKRYKVDYTQAFSDVCKEFVKFCIDHSDPTRALDIICRPWAPDAPKSTPKRTIFQTQKNNNATPSASSEKKKLSSNKADQNGKKDAKESHDHEKLDVGNTDQNGDKSSKESKYQERPETKSFNWEKAKDNIPLPSWIPRLTGAAYAMLPQAGVHTLKMGRKNADTLVGLPSSSQSLQRNYNAADTSRIDRKVFRFRKRATMKHHSLYVKGFILDTIVGLQPSSQGGAIPSGWAKAGGWRNVPHSDPPDNFWRTLVADRGRDGRNPPVNYSRACKESFIKGGLTSGSVNTTELINNERCSVVAQFCRRVQAVIWNRCLIKTQTGRLGLAGQYAQLEDVVCILYGCSVPVVLRRKWKTLEQVKQEVNEDARVWHENLAFTWREVCENYKAKRLRRVLLKLKSVVWNKKMQEKWDSDEEWQTKWHQTVRDKKSAQEKVDKIELTERIKSEKEEMGYFVQSQYESDKDYEERLRLKSYKFWREGKKAAAGEALQNGKAKPWDEPRPKWREFELYLKFGRRWKAAWRKRKELANARQRLRSLKEQQQTAPVALENEQQPTNVSYQGPLTEPAEAVNGFQYENHNVGVDKIGDINGLSSQDSKMDEPTESPNIPSQVPQTGEPKELPSSASPAELYMQALTEKFMEKFIASSEKEKGLQEPEHTIDQDDSDDMQRLKQNWCYYELLGECYVHGMMDGEAMKYQNEAGIKPQVFELR